MRLVLVLEGDKLPTAGEMRRRYRHWAAYKRLREAYGWKLIAAPTWDSEAAVFRPVRRKVTITTYRPVLMRDKDNLYASVKALMDAMTDVRLIFDDSEKYIDLTVEQALARGRTRTEIIIEEE